jgi:hypothetical protein
LPAELVAQIGATSCQLCSAHAPVCFCL